MRTSRGWSSAARPCSSWSGWPAARRSPSRPRACCAASSTASIRSIRSSSVRRRSCCWPSAASPRGSPRAARFGSTPRRRSGISSVRLQPDSEVRRRVATMKKALTFAVLVIASLVLLASCGPEFDLIVRNGDVIDGTGAAARRADVAVRGDRVADVGSVRGRGRLEIDASGQVVAPGFIDVQGQSGTTLLVDGNGESHIRQGITTEVIGEGGTPALWTPQANDEPTIRQYRLSVDWSGFDGYLRAL